MSQRVVVAVATSGDIWTRLGSVGPEEPPGSITSDTGGHRDVYLFGWCNEAGPALWRSRDGVDATVDDGARLVISTGLDVVADLTTGPMIISVTGRNGTAQVRFTYQ